MNKNRSQVFKIFGDPRIHSHDVLVKSQHLWDSFLTFYNALIRLKYQISLYGIHIYL